MKKKGEISTEHTIVTSIEKVGKSEGQKSAYILFLTGTLVGKLHMLADGVTTIGRSRGCTLVLDDTRISRRHTEIRLEHGNAVLHDLGSTNGTFVNGERCETRVLQDGDKIQISSATIFKFALQDRTENIFHKELYKMAVIDAVTNIYNKRYFLERFHEELSHAKRTQKPIALLMIDIDHFKAVNDTHGHLAGDMVLHQVAQRLQHEVRTEDLLARYGGEEMAVLLRGADEPSALQLAERMRQTMAATPIPYEKNQIPVTISIGVAALGPTAAYNTVEEFIRAADECLYVSKSSGRNRVTGSRGGGGV